MADRFSRFNEDRDFQVNTGLAEDPGKPLADPGTSLVPVSRLAYLLGSTRAGEPPHSSASDFSRGLSA